jgi:hypothetical protein
VLANGSNRLELLQATHKEKYLAVIEYFYDPKLSVN